MLWQRSKHLTSEGKTYTGSVSFVAAVRAQQTSYSSLLRFFVSCNKLARICCHKCTYCNWKYMTVYCTSVRLGGLTLMAWYQFTQCICSVFLHWIRCVSLQMFHRHFTSFFNVIFMLKRAPTIIWPTFSFIIIFVHGILVYYCIYQYIDILDKSIVYTLYDHWCSLS